MRDGDTVILVIDRGLKAMQEEVIRIVDIDTKEIVSADRAEALTAKEWGHLWFMNVPAWEWPFLLQTFKPNPRDNYCRWQARIWREHDGHCYEDDILAAGLAVRA
jgi:endonuclease YncB( thermonuclease family)